MDTDRKKQEPELKSAIKKKKKNQSKSLAALVCCFLFCWFFLLFFFCLKMSDCPRNERFHIKDRFLHAMFICFASGSDFSNISSTKRTRSTDQGAGCGNVLTPLHTWQSPVLHFVSRTHKTPLLRWATKRIKITISSKKLLLNLFKRLRQLLESAHGR